MSSQPSRLGAPGTYESGEAMAVATCFIATLKRADGVAVPGAWVSVHLDGSGLLRPEGAYDAKTFTFQRTDESGVVQFTWLPGKGAPPGPIALRASAATAGSLTIRRL